MMSYLVLLRVDLGHEPLDLRPRQVGHGEEEDVLEVLVLKVPAVRQIEIPTGTFVIFQCILVALAQ